MLLPTIAVIVAVTSPVKGHVMLTLMGHCLEPCPSTNAFVQKVTGSEC
jgi:hypothetical protein